MVQKRKRRYTRVKGDLVSEEKRRKLGPEAEVGVFEKRSEGERK